MKKLVPISPEVQVELARIQINQAAIQRLIAKHGGVKAAQWDDFVFGLWRTYMNLGARYKSIVEEYEARATPQIIAQIGATAPSVTWVSEKPMSSRRPCTDSGNPPRLAEFLLTMLLKPSRADALIGDLNERFATECQKLGRDRAVRLYWARTLRSLGPLLWRAMGKALKWGAVIAAVRRLF